MTTKWRISNCHWQLLYVAASELCFSKFVYKFFLLYDLKILQRKISFISVKTSWKDFFKKLHISRMNKTVQRVKKQFRGWLLTFCLPSFVSATLTTMQGCTKYPAVIRHKNDVIVGSEIIWTPSVLFLTMPCHLSGISGVFKKVALARSLANRSVARHRFKIAFRCMKKMDHVLRDVTGFVTKTQALIGCQTGMMIEANQMIKKALPASLASKLNKVRGVKMEVLLKSR